MSTIQEIQQKLLKRAQELRDQQAIANRQNFHKELNQQYKGEDDPADFFEGLVD